MSLIIIPCTCFAECFITLQSVARALWVICWLPALWRMLSAFVRPFSSCDNGVMKCQRKDGRTMPLWCEGRMDEERLNKVKKSAVGKWSGSFQWGWTMCVEVCRWQCSEFKTVLDQMFWKTHHGTGEFLHLKQYALFSKIQCTHHVRLVFLSVLSVH